MYFSTTAILLIVSTAVMGLIQMYLVMGYFQEDKRTTLNDVVQVTAMQVQEDSPLRRLLEDESARTTVQDQMKLIGRTSSTNLLLTDASGQVMLYTQNEAEQLIGSQVDAEILRQAQDEDGFLRPATWADCTPENTIPWAGSCGTKPARPAAMCSPRPARPA